MSLARKAGALAVVPLAAAAALACSGPPNGRAEGAVGCPRATTTVRDGDSLTAALARARPGDSVRLTDGVYEGRFVAARPATADRPIFLCGSAAAVIDAGGINGGYALYLDGASHWRVVGFTVRNGQKGVMADRVTGVVIQGLTVERIGDEGIHLRNFSSDNVVRDNTVRDTGRRRAEYGEGIYIGTAKSNWCTISGCRPDRSDRNVVRGNDVSATTAECVDIKEGTTGGLVVANRFDGSRLGGTTNDSWVDVKGNGWRIEGNTGRNAPGDGFQTHQVVDGWGIGNVFVANRAEVNGPGWAFRMTTDGNRVTCDNEAVGAAKGLANIDCS